MASSRSTSSPGSIDDLEYERRPMVGWFTPLELARAGVRAALSALFGAYADNRELQAALVENLEPQDYSGPDEIWIDYIADLGDGWASTYTMARLLAEEKLELVRGEDKYATERGSIVVMGGDEVYPVANREEYHDRMVGPYRSALPYVADEDRAPHLYVIPGNHDWYDGLTSFRRLFCHQRWIGGWRTRQKRSYFALKLPHGWWLWGIDTQLESDVDQPQLDFFYEVARNKMEPGSKIILCCAEPTWLYKKTKGEDAYTNLGYFERKIILKHGHHFTVGLSGDLHSYTRWEQDAGKKQRFVAGGGGAYLYPTHNYPEELSLPSEEPGEEERYSRKTEDALFPDARTSRLLAVKSLLFPLKNASFAAFLGFFYLWFTWIVQSVSVTKEGGDPGSLLDKMSELRPDFHQFGGVVRQTLDILAHSPESVLLLALLVIGWIFFADAKSLVRKLLLGAPHAVAHCALMFALMWVVSFVTFDEAMMGMKLGNTVPTILYSVEMIVAGGLLGGALVGLYLFLANFLFHRHTNEVFLCQSIPDYKNFVRLHIGKDGRLTLYPVGVSEVPREDEYRFVPNSEEGAAWFEPANGSIGDYARLIEAPIDVGS